MLRTGMFMLQRDHSSHRGIRVSGAAPKRMPVLSRAAWVLEHMVAFPGPAGEPGQAALLLPGSSFSPSV